MTPQVSVAFQTDKPLAAYGPLAARAEQLGFDGVSVFHDFGYPPSLGPLLAMAAATSRVRLGAACLNPSLLHPIEIAGQVAALDVASDGRAYVGLARGAWLDRVGLRPDRPLTRLAEAVDLVRRLLAGDESGYDGRVFSLASGTVLQCRPERGRVDVLIGTWGEQGIALAGRRADEVKLGGCANPDTVRLARKRLDDACRADGRDPLAVGLVAGAVTVVAEDGAAARTRAATEVAMYVDVVAGLDSAGPVPEADLAPMRAALAAGDVRSAGRLLPRELLRRFAFAGTPTEVAEHAAEVVRAGASRIEFGTPHGLSDGEGLQLLGTGVLPVLREVAGVSRIAAVADELLRELAPVDTDAAEALGAQPDNLMPALAPADFAARHDARERAVRALVGAGEPSADERVLAAALGERLASDQSLDDIGFTTALLAPLATPVHRVRGVFDSLPHGTPADWRRVAEHLERVPGALHDYADTLRTAAGAGHVVAVRQIRVVAEQCESWIADADFYRRLVAGADPASQDALDRGAHRAGDATVEFADFLRTELLPRAPQRDGAGPDRYAVTARAFLGDDVDLADTYAFGWDELARLSAEMTAVAGELGADSIEQAAAELDADPARRLGTDQLAGWLQGRVDAVTAAVDGVHFDLPPQARRAECAVSPTASGVMYYDAPDPAFTRPGRIWWSAPEGGVSHDWREVTTAHHEGVPGHHLQITVAMAEAGLHPWQRSMANVHGYAEGWAHYAERLADELGLLPDPAERLGMLYGQRWRAARIVIDMGLHLDLPIPAGTGFTEARAWTPAVGVEVLRRASGADATTARFEIDRYLGWPGQALAFRVGARLWRELRAAAEVRPGFDLRRFHMGTLRLGPMGLGPLRELVLGADR